METWMLLGPLLILITGACRAVSLSSSTRYTDGSLHPAAFSVPSAGSTGTMVYYAGGRFWQRDREYRFNYRQVNGSWRAYIIRMPGLNGRSSDASSTHRLRDGNQYYICWDRPVHSLKDMQTISRVWANNLQEYIATGKRF